MAAEKEKEMLERKLHKDLSHDDKLENVKRLVEANHLEGFGRFLECIRWW